MNIKLSTQKTEQFDGDALVFFVNQPDEGAPVVDDSEIRAMLERAYLAGDFKGGEGQVFGFYPNAASRFRARRIMVVGLGEAVVNKKSNNGPGEQRELYRKAGGTAAAAAIKANAGRIMAVLPAGSLLSAAEIAECLAEGLLLGAYQFRKYKKSETDEEKPGSLDSIILQKDTVSASLRIGVERGRIAAEAARFARDMAHEPPNVMTPGRIAEIGRKIAAQGKLRCTVFSRQDLKKMQMNGILAVNSGSSQPPKLVVLEYKTRKKDPTLLLVGKGLTYDSGGINLKPTGSLEDMKYDMCGGAAILAVMQAVASEQPQGVNIVGMVPATENLPGPAAMKPGDILTMYGGKTVEVGNTDAEGRLILADALAYGVKKYKPAAVIDIATLTGAVVIGLGHHRTGLLASDDSLAGRILAAGERCGELLWRLPLGKEYTKQLKSDIADLKNVGNRTAGAITAAAFLQEFVGKTPWAHLDIAGTAWEYTEKSYVPKGPSAVGVRTLLEVIRQWREIIRK